MHSTTGDLMQVLDFLASSKTLPVPVAEAMERLRGSRIQSVQVTNHALEAAPLMMPAPKSEGI